MTQQLIDPRAILEQSDLVFSAQEVDQAIDKLALQINDEFGDAVPLVISVMGGATFFAGQLLPRLLFPLQFDYVQANRYRDETMGSELVWKVMPGDNVRGRVVLLLDDILDEGLTLAAIKEKCLAQGASRVAIAVLTEKHIGKDKPVKADYVGLMLPNRYVFGCGMDVYGWWRNLPAIYALKQS